MGFRSSVFVLVAGMGVSACAIPQQVELIEREQGRLRREYNALGEGLDGARSNLADTRANFAQLQAELGAVRGRVDEVERQTGRQIGQSTQEGNRRVRELEGQVARLESELKTQSAMLKNQQEELRSLREAVSGKQQAIPPATGESEEERKAYEGALRLLERKDYRGSITRFGDFLKKYSHSGYADNAHYWIGESHYALREFDQAILQFDVVRRKYPKGDKVPAALLKMGFAFAELGDKVDARLILQELIDRHPQSEEAVKARQKLKTF